MGLVCLEGIPIVIEVLFEEGMGSEMEVINLLVMIEGDGLALEGRIGEDLSVRSIPSINVKANAEDSSFSDDFDF